MNSTTDWISIFETFKKLNVVVVGDAMIDAYMWGNINRQSPEAPIPIVEVEKHEQRLGGAANVAINLKSLGANPTLCSVIGNDKSLFLQLMSKHGLSIDGILCEDRKTTTKTRIIAKNKHQLRVDEEDVFPIQIEEEFIENTCQLMTKSDAIIFQDYNKGVLTPKVIKTLISHAKKNNILTLVDPKKSHFWLYKGVNLFKPNLRELQEQCSNSIDIHSVDKLSQEIAKQRQKLNAHHFLLTLSEHGVFIQTDHEDHLIPAFNRNIVDVSGAGDCVIATATCALACGLSVKEIGLLSNLAGGLACERVGVNPIEKIQLLKEAIRLV